MAARRGWELVWGSLLAAALLSAPALAKEPAGEDPGTGPEQEVEREQAVRVFGRVFARASADEREDYERALSVPSARVGMSAALGQVEAELSADLSSRSPLKDAFIRLADKDKRLRLYGGQFKAPFLARALESAWQLPLVRRGLVEKYLVDAHQLGGRRLGLMGEARLERAWALKLAGGLFQGAREKGGGHASEDAAARVSARPLRALTVGLGTYLAEVTKGTRRHALGADGELRLGALALSGELVTGRLAPGPFTAQLGLARYTLPLSEDWALQPVVGGEALQLRGHAAGRGWAAVGGLNLLLARSFKLQLQAEHALRPGDEAPGTEYSLQLATRF